MPLYEYICPAGHTTERVVSLKKTPPREIKCRMIVTTPHAKRVIKCALRAKKRTVYRVAVSGDLPTRGAF